MYSVNVKCGKAEERYLLTGLHAVADIHCNSCKTTLGWKYVSGKHVIVAGAVLGHLLLEQMFVADAYFVGI